MLLLTNGFIVWATAREDLIPFHSTNLVLADLENPAEAAARYFAFDAGIHPCRANALDRVFAIS